MSTVDPRAAQTTASVRQRNRTVALQYILRERETTRADLSRATGLSSAASASIVTELINDGLVAEVGAMASRGGRPIAVIGPRADGGYAIGADIGERGVAVELFDLTLTMVDREFRGGGKEETPDRIWADLREAVDALLGSWRAVGGEFTGSGWQAIGALLDDAVAGGSAAAVLDEAIEALGAALGSIVNLTNPRRVVVGGWVGLRLMERHAEPITAAVRRNCLHRSGEQFDLVPATFGGDTVALGSALVPIEVLIGPPR